MTEHFSTDDFLAIGQLTQLPLEGVGATDTTDPALPMTLPPAPWLSNLVTLTELTRDITELRRRLARANRAFCAETDHLSPALCRLLAYALGELELQARVMKVNIEQRVPPPTKEEVRDYPTESQAMARHGDHDADF